MANYTDKRLDQIWEKGSTIRGKNPDLYRKDKYGNTMYRRSYGKTSKMGWNVDHSKPISLGGTDHLNNLQPMNSKVNSSKGKQYPK
ncbi:MAG: HNH endonuclease signature motif containing protein [Bacteroidales bacterium]